MQLIEFTNQNNKRVSIDPAHVCAVVDRGHEKVGIRLNHPDIIVVTGDYLEVKTRVEQAKAKIRNHARETV